MRSLPLLQPAPSDHDGDAKAVLATSTWLHLCAKPVPMKPHKPRQYLIHGQTLSGQTFRPSDWSERLAGAMSSFRPGGAAQGIASFIGYSPYCVPQVSAGIKCVQVNEALRDIEPMAWDFVMNFARDNQLQVTEVELPAVAVDALPDLPG